MNRSRQSVSPECPVSLVHFDEEVVMFELYSVAIAAPGSPVEVVDTAMRVALR